MSKQIHRLFSVRTLYRSTFSRLCHLNLICAIIFTAFCLPSQAADADIAYGEKLSQTCMGCHGAPGLRNPGPVYEIPMVGGQDPDYIIAALQAYKAKTRSHGTMQAQAANLSDQDMTDIAAYFSSLEDNSRPGNVNASLAAQGQEISALCATCHGPSGDGVSGITPIPPKLAGQYQSYLVQSLKDYRSGARDDAIMTGFVGTLTIDQIRALSAWYASQNGGLSAPESSIFK